MEFSTAIARPQAYTHFGASEFPQVCETIRTLLVARSNEISTKIPNPAPQPSTDKPNHIHNIGVGVVIVVLGAAVLWVIAHYLGIQL